MLAANEAVARELARRRVLLSVPRARAAAAPTACKTLAQLPRRLRHPARSSSTARRRPKALPGRAREGGRAGPRSGSSTRSSCAPCSRRATRPSRGAHFGLAIEPYTHFTSPIRRYPDLVVQRLLDMALRGGVRVPADLAEIAAQSSRRERVAMEAEREIVQLKKIQFMRTRSARATTASCRASRRSASSSSCATSSSRGSSTCRTLGDDHYEHVETQHACAGGARGARSASAIRCGSPSPGFGRAAPDRLRARRHGGEGSAAIRRKPADGAVPSAGAPDAAPLLARRRRAARRRDRPRRGGAWSSRRSSGRAPRSSTSRPSRWSSAAVAVPRSSTTRSSTVLPRLLRPAAAAVDAHEPRLGRSSSTPTARSSRTRT